MEALASIIAATKAQVEQTKAAAAAGNPAQPVLLSRADFDAAQTGKKRPRPADPDHAADALATPPSEEAANSASDADAASLDRQVATAAVTPAASAASLAVAMNGLRKRGQPVRLFGEDPAQVILRWEKFQIERAENSEHQLAAQLLKREPVKQAETTSAQAKPVPSCMDLVQSECESESAFAVEFWRRAVRQWEAIMTGQASDADVHDLPHELATGFVEMKSHIKPYFRGMVKGELPEEVVAATNSMAVRARQREYTEAAEVYMDLAIGRAAWPIGQAPTGIHARSARTRLMGQGVAHVLNDERTRKYLTALKSVLSFVQWRFPRHELRAANA